MTSLDGAWLAERCASNRFVARRIRLLETTTSTNDVCHESAADLGNDGLVVFAEHQTAGRGQHGRTWVAPPGSALLFSILLFPPGALRQPGFLTAWAAVAIAEHLRNPFGLDCRVKWPNDLVIRGRKVCGILVECRMATVVGVGLNVAIRRHEFPRELRQPATSLLIESGRQLDRTRLAGDLLVRLDELYADARERGPARVWPRWSELAEHQPGAHVVVATRQTQVAGRLLDLRPDRGARVLRSDDTVARIPPEELLRIDCEPPS